MQLLAPDILEEARSLSPFLSGAGVFLGFLLWSFGGRTHRFWLAMSVTLAAGLLGLVHGKEYGMQPLVAGLLLAVSAGALALSLVRILLFAAGGLAALGVMQVLAPAWDEPIAIFLVGGLIGVVLYRFWIATFSSVVGSLLMAYSALALLDRLHRMDSVAWTEKNGPLLNWGCVSLIVTGVLVQFLLECRRQNMRMTAAEPEPIVLALLLRRPNPLVRCCGRWAKRSSIDAPARGRTSCCDVCCASAPPLFSSSPCVRRPRAPRHPRRMPRRPSDPRPRCRMSSRSCIRCSS